MNGAMIVKLCSRVSSSTILPDRLATISSSRPYITVAYRRERAVTVKDGGLQTPSRGDLSLTVTSTAAGLPWSGSPFVGRKPTTVFEGNSP